jgi:putative oxidoreductase
MTLRDRFSALLVLGRRVAELLHPVAPLITRLVLGVTFIGTGHGKWQHIDDIAGFFASLHIPAPAANAAFIATLELVGGAMLILGFGTRVFAALLSCTMIVALMTADEKSFLYALKPATDKGLTDVVPFVYLMLLLWLVAYGAGAWSVDRFVRWGRPAKG